MKRTIGTAQKTNKLNKIELILDKREENRLDLGVIPRPILSCGIPLHVAACNTSPGCAGLNISINPPTLAKVSRIGAMRLSEA